MPLSSTDRVLNSATKRQLLNNYEIRLMLAELVASQGASAREILAGTGVSPALLDNPSQRLTLEQELELYTRIAHLNTDPLLGMRVGARQPLSSYGILGYAMMGAETVREALELLTEFSPLVSWASRNTLGLERHGDLCCYCFSMFPTAADSRAAALEIESTIASLLTVFDELAGEPVQLAGIEMSYAYPQSSAAQLRQFLPCPVRFNSDRDALLLPMSLVDMRLPFPQPQYSALFRDMCRQSMNALTRDRGLVDEIRKLVTAREGAVPTLEQVAGRFNMSSRTLRRHLHSIGFSYRGLLDEMRYAQACRYLASTELTVDAIARRLGYADARSFRTAFRRWSGLTPANYRAFKAPAL
jgi:AraC-like DNA-binding protein